MINTIQTKLTALLLCSAVLFVFSGCLSSSETTHEKHEKEIEKVPSNPGTALTGECANEYYPVMIGSERDFKVTGIAPAEYKLKQAKSEKGFTETRTFESGLEVTSNWSCGDEGLRNADYNNAISKSDVNIKMETLESEGITIPKVWEKGKKWSATYKIRTRMDSNTVDGTVKVDNEIVDMEENVKVQAGDYVAARVDSVITVSLTVGATNIEGAKISMSNWYAKDVGIIKQEVKTGSKENSIVEFVGDK